MIEKYKLMDENYQDREIKRQRERYRGKREFERELSKEIDV